MSIYKGKTGLYRAQGYIVDILHRVIKYINTANISLGKINILWKECPVANHMKCIIIDLNLNVMDDKKFTYLYMSH